MKNRNLELCLCERCLTNSRIAKERCPGVLIREDVLLDSLADMLQNALDAALGSYSLSLLELPQQAAERTELNEKIASRKQEIQRLRGLIRSLYENLIQDILTKDEYITYKAVDSLNAVYDALQMIRKEMLRLAALLPEFDVVMSMFGAGNITGPQLMAEIGDVRRFTHKGALVAFAGVDAPPYQSGMFDSKTRHVSKRGSPHLRKTLFTICSVILQHANTNDPVYLFMDKKRSEGKHYYVFMIAGAAKFLRIYYARVKEALLAQETEDTSAA